VYLEPCALAFGMQTNEEAIIDSNNIAITVALILAFNVFFFSYNFVASSYG